MRVKVLEKVWYAGRDREIGEEFETDNDDHGKVLAMAGKVIAAETTVTENPEPRVPSRSGRYKRRDLRADDK